MRRERAGRASAGPDLGLLWAEIQGVSDYATYLWLRLRRSLDGIEGYLVRDPTARVQGQPLREQVTLELRAAERRMGAAVPRSRTPKARREAAR